MSTVNGRPAVRISVGSSANFITSNIDISSSSMAVVFGSNDSNKPLDLEPLQEVKETKYKYFIHVILKT